MKIVCDSCGAKYAVADEKVAGKSVRIRCKKCGAVLLLHGEPAAATPATRPGAEWFVVVDGETKGPFVAAELAALGGPDALVWREGQDGWRPAHEVPELAVVTAPQRKHDLFAAAESDDVVASPRPRVAAPLTGERNESSMLFSLANLQSLAGATPSAKTPSGAPAAGMASGDGSGLVDIRALAGAVAAPARSGAPHDVDALLAIGGGASPFSPTLGAPILAPVRPASSSRGVVLGAALGGLAVAVAAAMIAVVIVAKGSGARAAEQTPDAPRRVAHVEAPRVAPPIAAPAPPPVAVVAVAEPAPRGTPSPAAAARPRRARHGEPTLSPAIAPAQPHPVATPTPRGDEPPSMHAVDDIFGPRAPSPTHEVTPTLPPTPPRDQVMAALRAAQPAVAACGQGVHGLATTQLTIAGDTGRVTSATVSGALAGTPAGSCVARAARTVHVQRFSQATFSVTYPFAL